jgi:hypothetical protein
MIRELKDEDFCPKCLEYDDEHRILYVGRANHDLMTVEFRCAFCDFVDVRKVTSI